MSIEHELKIAEELGLKQIQVEAVSKLLEDGATVPFIARYRKEATGTLDEVAIINIRDRLEQLKELDKRRESILESLKERELLTEELNNKIIKADKTEENITPILSIFKKTTKKIVNRRYKMVLPNVIIR